MMQVLLSLGSPPGGFAFGASSQAARQGFPPFPRHLWMLVGNFHLGSRSAQGVILFDPNFFLRAKLNGGEGKSISPLPCPPCWKVNTSAISCLRRWDMPGVCQLKFKLTLNSVASCGAQGAGGVSSSYRCGQAAATDVGRQGERQGAEWSCQLAFGNSSCKPWGLQEEKEQRRKRR